MVTRIEIVGSIPIMPTSILKMRMLNPSIQTMDIPLCCGRWGSQTEEIKELQQRPLEIRALTESSSLVERKYIALCKWFDSILSDAVR